MYGNASAPKGDFVANEHAEVKGASLHTVRGTLYEEHLALGASFDRAEDTGLAYPSSYAGEEKLEHALEGAAIADLTGATYRLVSGAHPQELCEAAFCAKKLRVGQCAFEPALTGDGAITSVPLLAHTGAHEYVLLDPSRRGAVVAGWLTFLSQVSSNGNAPYDGTTLEEASGMLAPVLVMGARANELLADYLPQGARALPARGAVESVTLDGHIPALIAGVPLDTAAGVASYVLLVPKAAARVMWRSLLSFSWVEPVGRSAVLQAWSKLPWSRALDSTDVVEISEQDLRAWGLLRHGNDFVGARGIHEG